MAEPAISSSQSNGFPFQKTFSAYVQTTKTFQPFVSPTAAINISPNLVKSTQLKNCSISNSCGMINGSCTTSSKIQNPQTKTVPSFLENRSVMKTSMINSEQETSTGKQPRVEATAQQQTTQNAKKVPRMSQHPDMKLSSIQLGTEGYKVPSFLSKQKKTTHLSPSDRPQSSKDIQNIKDSQQSDNLLNNSSGPLKKKSSDFLEVKDPTQQWIKSSWCKKKQKIFGINNFQQIKQLGTGKYGKVYLVRQKQSNFICALKVLEKSLIKQQQITQQLIRQLKIQTFINHTNIIKMFGFFDDATNIYLIMELATGGQLFQQLKKHQSMPQAKVASIMRQICHAVDELHSYRIIHRDIKPQNIVLSGNVIKLCDFGWSVYCDSNLRTTFCGTPLYVGPQILKGKQYDEKIDIWSLGVMMYQMLVGQNPFKITKQEELMKIIKDQIIIPKYVQVSPSARNFLFGCLQKNPAQRMTIRELLNHEFFKLYPEKVDKKLNI